MRHHTRLCFSAFIVFTFATTLRGHGQVNSTASAESPVSTQPVETRSGPVVGKWVTTSTGAKAQAFLGIPYGESTAGEQRWRPPVAKAPWKETLRCVESGPIPPQPFATPELKQ